MIYNNNNLDSCENGNHKWSTMDRWFSVRGIGERTVIGCLNCLAVKIIQKVDQFDGKECIGYKVTTTIVEPRDDGIFEAYEK